MITWNPLNAISLIVAGLGLLTAGVALLTARHYYRAIDRRRAAHRRSAESLQYWQAQTQNKARTILSLDDEVARLKEEAATWRRAYEQTAPDTVDEGAPA